MTENSPNQATADLVAAPESPEAGAATPTQIWRSRIERCKALRRNLLQDWSENVDYRRGKPFQDDSDNDRVQVPTDWSATKAKQAQLFSQVPEVRLTHKSEAYKAAAPMFAKKLNDQLCLSRVGVAMDEALPDCINASGFGAVLSAYEALTEQRTIPRDPPDIVAQLKQRGLEVPMVPSTVVLDYRFTNTRVSPADALWETSFTGSDFNDSPWVGNSGRLPKAAAQKEFRLSDEDLAQAVGGDSRSNKDVLSSDSTNQRYKEADQVEYDQIFYRRHLYHADETSYDAIQRMVFVHGKTEPVINEPWKGQKRDANGKLRGSRHFPIQFLTLTYLSDESIPPSDSAMGRPQTNELNRSRSQMIKNRENSTPWRWFDTNRVDINVQTQLMRGTWQGAVPMNGDGSRAMGEVARASYPNEDFNFDNIAKADLRETWQIEDTIGSGPAIRSAEEARNRQSNFQTRIGYERARCAQFFVRIAEVNAGLLSLFGQWTDEEKQRLGGLDPETLSDYYAFNVRADSTLLVDSEQRVERLLRFLNMTAKSGFVEVAPIIAEIAELEGIDPAAVMTKPPEKAPEPLSTSLRLTGSEDLSNPIVLALLDAAGQLPTPEQMNNAKMLLASLKDQPTIQPPAPPGAGGPDGGAPPAQGGGPGAPAPPPPAGAPPAPPSAPGGRVVRPAAPYSAHPEWNTASRVEKRAEDGK